jgi:choline dehydrogenase-like flavoprotein
MAGTIVEGRNVADNVTLIPDFCIIGSGAGGGVCALKLTEAGFDVLVLEEGPTFQKKRTSARAGAKDAQRAFLLKAPRFIETVDDYRNYQRPQQRDQFLLALLIAEVTYGPLISGNFKHFSHLSLADRRKILEKLRSSGQELRRSIYAAFVNVSASTYYASDLTWPDLNYKGVSVDHPDILTQPPPIPWRPKDLRPIEP